MPSRVQYEQLSLAEAVRWLAELHFDARTRHLSSDEYELLNRAADVIAERAPDVAAFS
jgi:hypothetical protein